MAGSKKSGYRVILSVFFALLAILIVMPLLAQVQFDSAERLIVKYLWKDAADELKSAIKLDPYDSRYPARLGEFLFMQSGYKDDPTALLNAAEGYYERAAALNPCYAGYSVRIGQINVKRAIDSPEAATAYAKRAFWHFRNAAAKDPNGFNTVYAAGYSGLAVWKYLDNSEKAFVVGRLRSSLEQRPSYAEYIYPQVLLETEDASLLYRITPRVNSRRWIDMDKVSEIKSSAGGRESSGVILNKDWENARSAAGAYEGGAMYWSGTMYGAIAMPKGRAVISVGAKGTPADGIYPYMIVSLDGKRIGGAYVNSANFKEYRFDIGTEGGVKVLSVTFTNDARNKTEDRNLYISNAKVE